MATEYALIVLFPLLALATGEMENQVVEAQVERGEAFAQIVQAGPYEVQLSGKREDGIWTLRLAATKDGLKQSDPRFSQDRFVQRLDGTYSIPAREPDGRVRFVLDRVGQVLHGFWGFEVIIAGERRTGWMQFPPIAMPEQAALRPVGNGRRVTTRRYPSHDRDDRKTGFRAAYRDYHWSGTEGKAWVITFGDACPWRAQDVKLVFAEGAAWVPGYQLSRRQMVMFEFIETWGGGAKGCYEPMSDRVDRFGKMELVEDRADRKVLRWTYRLANPDYILWGALAGGKQEPEVEELWTVFPDGSARRRQRYWPCLDSNLQQHHLGNQVAELDAVWAADTLPEEVTPKVAASVFSAGRSYELEIPSQRKPDDPRFANEAVFGVAAHSRDPLLPDVFMAFARKDAGNPPLQLSTDEGPDWHRERLWRFCHFPFNCEPFLYETNTQTSGRGQITHSSLVYVGAPADRDWTSSYRVDSRGRKFREWTSVVGLGRPRDFAGMLAAHARRTAR
jgi:hypothetical protein